jgi:L-amino acid N-acyltransferase YncA
VSASVSGKAKDLSIIGLRNQHAVENQAIELLERRVGWLENHPAMEARMRQHIDPAVRRYAVQSTSGQTAGN